MCHSELSLRSRSWFGINLCSHSAVALFWSPHSNIASSQSPSCYFEVPHPQVHTLWGRTPRVHTLRGRTPRVQSVCNTSLPEYVPSCLFIFSDRIFWFASSICFALWIIYIIVLSWIRIRGLGVSSSLNREPDPSVLLDLVFSLFWFDQFQFQTSFSNILDFFMIFWNFPEFIKIPLDLVSASIAGWFQEF